MGMPFLFQVYGGWHSMGITQSKAYYFFFAIRNALFLNQKDCKVKSPPGPKVYQRGAHTIWEIDGAKEKVTLISLTTSLHHFVTENSRLSFSLALLSEPFALWKTLYRCQDTFL